MTAGNLLTIPLTQGTPTGGNGNVSSIDNLMGSNSTYGGNTITDICVTLVAINTTINAVSTSLTSVNTTVNAVVTAVNSANTNIVAGLSSVNTTVNSVVTAVNNANTNIVAGLTSVNTTVEAVVTSVTAVNTLANSINTVLGAKTDAANTYTNTTAISQMSVLKQISNSMQTLVSGGIAANVSITSLNIGNSTVVANVLPGSTLPVASDPAMVVALRPDTVLPAGRALPGNSSPVVLNSQIYITVAQSESANVMSGGGGGAKGDYLDFLLITPGNTSPGNVAIVDGSLSAYTVFVGGANSLTTTVPFPVPVGAVSSNGAWKVTTGANVTVLAVGNFT